MTTAWIRQEGMMVALTSLVVPLIVASIVVFIASSLIHMVLGYHRLDFRELAEQKQEEVQKTVRGLSLAAGEYVIPHPSGPRGMNDPAFLARMKEGPLVLMTLAPGAALSLGRNLAQWFACILLTLLFAAYVTSRSLGPGTDYLEVFRFIGTTAFMGFSLALTHESIWYRRAWARTLRSMGDGLVYALLAAGVFGWLWPR